MRYGTCLSGLEDPYILEGGAVRRTLDNVEAKVKCDVRQWGLVRRSNIAGGVSCKHLLAFLAPLLISLSASWLPYHEELFLCYALSQAFLPRSLPTMG